MHFRGLAGIPGRVHVAVLVHPLDPFLHREGGARRPNPAYLLGQLARRWLAAGHVVTTVRSPKDLPERVDLGILHVDASVVPAPIVELAGRLPRCVNLRATDIRKRRVSQARLVEGDGWTGPVIVKSNLNYGGRPEVRANAFAARKGRPPAFPGVVERDDYRVLPSRDAVPREVLDDPALAVDRFVPERDPAGYAVRFWVFAGEAERCNRYVGPEPVLKAGNAVSRAPCPVPDELRAERERLGVDFGKFDFVVVDGRPILLDANKTPSGPPSPTDEIERDLDRMAEALLAFSPRPRAAWPAGGSPAADAGQWPLAARIWPKLGPPMRPGPEDVRSAEAALSRVRAERGRVRGLVLGVTPELCDLPWPDRGDVTAVDRTPEMIRYVWPGDPARVRLEDWRVLALPAGSVDLACCDGGVTLVDPAGRRAMWARLAEVLAPGGLLSLRLFVPPAVAEDADDVLVDLLAGRVPSLDHLKLRLLPAMQRSPDAGVVLASVWERLRSVARAVAGEAAPEDALWPALAARLGWSLSHLTAIDGYRGSSARYHFVGRDVVSAEAAAVGFAEEWVRVPSYPLGERCPTLLLRRAR